MQPTNTSVATLGKMPFIRVDADMDLPPIPSESLMPDTPEYSPMSARSRTRAGKTRPTDLEFLIDAFEVIELAADRMIHPLTDMQEGVILPCQGYLTVFVAAPADTHIASRWSVFSPKAVGSPMQDSCGIRIVVPDRLALNTAALLLRSV